MAVNAYLYIDGIEGPSTSKAKCIDMYVAIMAVSIMNSVSDVYLFLLPIRWVWALSLPKKQISIFLRHLWATDGCLWLGQGSRAIPRIYYSTSSHRLALDVQSLLLRLGITARVHPVRGRDARSWFNVDVSGADDRRRFLVRVGGLGEQRRQTEAAILEHQATRAANTNRDVIPPSAWRGIVVPAMQREGVTSRELQSRLEMSSRLALWSAASSGKAKRSAAAQDMVAERRVFAVRASITRSVR